MRGTQFGSLAVNQQVAGGDDNDSQTQIE